MPAINLLITPQKQAIPAAGGTIDVLVRVQAPDQPEGQATPLTPKRLALVVDRSGSMDGEPLTEALRCVDYIASHLGTQDELAIVVYDDQADLLRPLAPVGIAREINSLLATVSSGGSTDLFAGWHTGARQLEAVSANKLSRVLILSDGQANRGLVTIPEIEAQCRQWLERGVSTTTVGLGRGFNEDLMIAMANAGGGQQYYGQTAEDLHDSFAQELSLLQSLYARKVDVKLVPGSGVIIEPLGIVRPNPDGSYRLSDLAWGAETWIALRLHLNPGTQGELRDLLVVTASALDMAGAPVAASAPMLRLPSVDQTAYDAVPTEAVTERRVQEVEFATQSQRLREMARDGDTAGVKALLAQLQTRFGAHPWLADKLENLRQLAERDLQMMEKEVRFSSERYSKRLAAKGEIQFSVNETLSDSVPMYLRRKSSEGRGRRSS